MSKAPEPGIVLTGGPKGRAAAALIKELVEAGQALSDFAWGSCVQTDCEESRVYLQSLIDGLRNALSRAGVNR